MSQSDFDLANQSRSLFRADNNAALQALATLSSGATEPTTMYAYQWWADTSSGLLKQRNSANNAWVIIGTLGASNLGLLALTGGTLTGALNEAQGSDIASASTVNLTTATGNYVHITGTTTITSITLAQGASRTVVFDGALTLTNGASLLLPSSANITTAEGDTAVFRGEATGVVRCIAYVKKDGTPLAGGSATDKIQPITASVGSNALTITLNPTVLDFRSSTSGSGTVNTRTVSTAISVVVSSGSTLGTVNAVKSRLAVLAIDNAGTVELAVVNLAGGVNLDETGVISTTAEGGAGAADSATVVYSTTARTNVSYRVVGFVESTQATAGTWATAPSTIQGAGGQSLQRLNALCNGVPVTASGTAVDFTGIPSWAKRVLITLNSISLSATSVLLVQLGDAGGIENTGYLASGSLIAVSVASTAFTTGFGLSSSSAAAYVYSGIVELCLVGGTTWVESASLGVSTGVTATALSGGTKTLSDVLTQIRVTTNGADTIDAGSINIIYE